MLPIRIITFVIFITDRTLSIPVFNMQPAHITANIGSMGRNIRHLPCVSLRTGTQGTCMFAIDCLKANGTHLGTCIDRFYFGSCCHLPAKQPPPPLDSLSGVLDNTIDENEAEIKEKFPSEASIVKLDYTTTTLKPFEGLSTFTSISSSKLTTSTTSDSDYSERTSETTLVNDDKPITLPLFQTTTTLRPESSTTARRTPPPTTTTQKFVTTQTVETTVSNEPIFDTTLTTTTQRPTPLLTTQKVITNTKPSTTTTTVKTRPSTRRPITTTTTRTTTKRPNTTTKRITTTTRRPSTPPVKTTSNKINLQNEVVKNPVKKNNTQTTTELPLKLTTFQTVVSVSAHNYTAKPVKPSSTSRPKPTNRPSVTKITTISSVKPVTKPLTSTTTKRTTVGTVTKRPTTRKPVITTTTLKATELPPWRLTTLSNRKPVITTTELPPGRLTTLSNRKPEITTTTLKPSEQPPWRLTTLSNRRPVNDSTITSTTTSTSLPPLLIPVQTIKPDIVPQKPSSTSSLTTPSTVTLLSQQENEIIDEQSSSATTDYPPGLVTWTSIIDLSAPSNVTTSNIKITTLPPPTTSTPNISNMTEDWSPITPPDGWVLLPSVSPNNLTSTIVGSSIGTTTLKPLVTTTTSMSTTHLVDTTLSTSNQSTTSSVPIQFPTDSSSQPPVVFPTEFTTIDLNVENVTTMTTTTERWNASSTLMGETLINITTTLHYNASTTSSGFEDFTIRPDINMSDYTQVCGRRMFPQARIVGGDNSTFGRWPWQISLRQWRTSTYLHKCGAALLNENWAITAAHCVDSVPPSDLLLRLGEHDLSSESEPYGFQERRVQIVASHPQFDHRTFEYDLALLRFYEPVTFQPNIIPVCVPESDEGYVGRTAHVTGWGRLYEDGPLPNVLQEVSVPVINNSVCEQMYRSAGYIEHIPNIFICAGWRRGGFDSCEGDSGGPMVIQRPQDKRFILAGVISWGIGCAEPNQPGVYTRISEFRHWINQILQF